MDVYHLVFYTATYVPGPLWLALVVAPQNYALNRVIDAVILLFCGLYAALIIPDLPRLVPIIAQATPEVLASAFSTVPAISIAWTHFVIGDLWIGRWIACDSQKHGFPLVARLPLLLLTLFFGPIGFLTYSLLRSLRTRKNPLTFSAT